MYLWNIWEKWKIQYIEMILKIGVGFGGKLMFNPRVDIGIGGMHLWGKYQIIFFQK